MRMDKDGQHFNFKFNSFNPPIIIEDSDSPVLGQPPPLHSNRMVLPIQQNFTTDRSVCNSNMLECYRPNKFYGGSSTSRYGTENENDIFMCESEPPYKAFRNNRLEQNMEMYADRSLNQNSEISIPIQYENSLNQLRFGQNQNHQSYQRQNNFNQIDYQSPINQDRSLINPEQSSINQIQLFQQKNQSRLENYQHQGRNNGFNENNNLGKPWTGHTINTNQEQIIRINDKYQNNNNGITDNDNNNFVNNNNRFTIENNSFMNKNHSNFTTNNNDFFNNNNSFANNNNNINNNYDNNYNFQKKFNAISSEFGISNQDQSNPKKPRLLPPPKQIIDQEKKENENSDSSDQNDLKILVAQVDLATIWYQNLKAASIKSSNFMFQVVGRLESVRVKPLHKLIIIKHITQNTAIQCIFYEIDRKFPPIVIGSIIIVSGHMIGEKIIKIFDVEQIYESEIQKLHRLIFLSERQLKDILTKYKNNTKINII